MIRIRFFMKNKSVHLGVQGNYIMAHNITDATWCGPCLMQAPILDQLAEEIDEDELKIVKIDVDENPETAQKFGIMSIPTLLFKKDGEVVKQVAGVHTKDQIKAIVAELS